MFRLIHVAAVVVIFGAMSSVCVAQTKSPKRPPTAAVAPSGAQVYSGTCAACHQPTGGGLPDKYPPLAGSEIVAGDEERLIRIVLQGLRGDVEVQGEVFNGDMPGWGPNLSNAQIASVLTYVRTSWGNASAPILTARVAEIRTATAKRKVPWTLMELSKLPLRGVR
jgi:mono/diheme cytochrome c family protein